VAALALVALLTLLGSGPAAGDAAAHPLGDFTINHFSHLLLTGRSVRIHYVIDMAEIPTYDEIREIDTNGDRQVDQTEQASYLPGRVERLRQGLRLTLGGVPLELQSTGSALRVDLGQAGLRVLRLDADFEAPLPDGSTGGDLAYEDTNFADRLGWREIVVTGDAGAEITRSDALSTSISQELRVYPPDSQTNPLAMSRVSIGFAADPRAMPQTAPGSSAAVAADSVRRASGGSAASNRVAGLISSGQLSPGLVLLALLAAALWGAAHALTPGHGKAVVAAYLVGARGTARHAVLLGLTVTLTHTAGVFALGALTLYLSRYVLPETLYPWLSVLSGLLVVAIGCTLAYRRLADGRTRGQSPHHHHHNHDHHHDHYDHRDHGHHHHLPGGADGATITLRGLLGLGISGGLVPCPSALVLLLSAISFGRLELGIVLVVAFSIGLAVVLTGIGLLSVYARRFFARFSFEPRVPRLLPVVSALVVTVAGLAVVVEALHSAGLL
jgi:ABC-type nickel/cobalt efflux system permease component RcnA